MIALVSDNTLLAIGSIFDSSRPSGLSKRRSKIDVGIAGGSIDDDSVGDWPPLTIAEALAARMQHQAPPTSGDRLDNQLNFGARLVLSRDLTAAERKVLRELHDKAGMTAVASALFNLDAALTR